MKTDMQLKTDVSDELAWNQLAPGHERSDAEVEGTIVTLSKMHSLAEHDAAIGTAFSTRGVSRVVDHLRVGN